MVISTNISKKLISVGLLLMYTAMPALAAENESIVPSFWTAWGSLDSGIKDKITLILGLCLVVLVVSVSAYTLINGGMAIWTRARGDAVGTSSALSNTFLGVVVLFVALLAIAAIFWIVG